MRLGGLSRKIAPKPPLWILLSYKMFVHFDSSWMAVKWCSLKTDQVQVGVYTSEDISTKSPPDTANFRPPTYCWLCLINHKQVSCYLWLKPVITRTSSGEVQATMPTRVLPLSGLPTDCSDHTPTSNGTNIIFASKLECVRPISDKTQEPLYIWSVCTYCQWILFAFNRHHRNNSTWVFFNLRNMVSFKTHYFTDDIFKCIFVTESVWVSTKISLKCLLWVQLTIL